MKGLKKAAAGLFALAAIAVFVASDAYASTGIYIGKDASAEGTTVIGVSIEPDEIGVAAVNEIIEAGSIRKGDVIESFNGYEYKMPADNYRMLVGRDMTYVNGIGWNNCASNEHGVSVVSYTITTPNKEAYDADPLVEDGISGDKIPTILAATSKTAREAVRTLCSIYEETGAREAEIILIADQDGAWVVENFTGHQYAATKLPDDCIGVFSDEPAIRTADPDDKDTICSSKLFTLPEENDFSIYGPDKELDLVLSYNKDNGYSTEPHLREWVAHDIFAPSEELEFDAKEGFDVFFKPDEKVSLAQAFDFFRNRFEGTAYDLNDADNLVDYRGINNQYVSGVSIFQIFDDVDEAMSTVLWSSPANPTAGTFIAIPVACGTIPEEMGTDVEKDEYDDDILQFLFGTLNNDVYPRRNNFGDSIRQYWEGYEGSVVSNVTDLVRGKWKDDFKESPDDAAKMLDEYLEESVENVKDNAERLVDEFEWFLFKNGVRSPKTEDSDIPVFECSFDAVSFARANGWETELSDELFTATKDGRTITVALKGENEGTVTLIGYDNDKLVEDFLSLDGYEVKFEETGEEEEDAGAEAVDAVEDTEETKEPEEAKEPEKEKEPEEAKEPEEVKEEKKDKTADKTKESSDEAAADEIAAEAAKQIEVDTIADLSKYFAEKTASIPRDGWAEGEIAKQLSGISNDVVAIIGKYFGGDITDLLGLDASKIANDEDIAKVGDRVVATGMDLSALVEKYFTSLYEDVSADVVDGRLTQEGAIKILNEAEGNIEGIARLYLEGIAGTFADVFNTDLSDEELKSTLAELGQSTLEIMNDYGAIDLESLGLGDIDIKDLTDADIEVIITLDAMDDDVIDGLSALLGVDVRSILDAYMQQLSGITGAGNVVEESRDTEKAYSAPDPEVIAAIETIEEYAADEDYIVPQEIIDALNEAIADSETGDGGDAPALENAGEAAPEEADADTKEAETEQEQAEFRIILEKIQSDDGKVMLPAGLLKYFK